MLWRKTFWIGLIGTAGAALCCFTPLLVIVLGTLGIAAGIWLDAILLPALAVFASVTVLAWIKMRRRS